MMTGANGEEFTEKDEDEDEKEEMFADDSTSQYPRRSAFLSNQCTGSNQATGTFPGIFSK
ncbi:hypothetical protein BH23VER1_BH23VER1_36580 [soil metagenome]